MEYQIRVERKVRPECWEFAMSFLGEPESKEIEEYVSKLEEMVRLAAVAKEREGER